MNPRPGTDLTFMAIALWLLSGIGGALGWTDVLEAALLLSGSVMYAAGRLAYQMEAA